MFNNIWNRKIWQNSLIKDLFIHNFLKWTFLIGTEDCLYVYVYVPRENVIGNENLEVVVHIHGGAFMIGAPKFMASPTFIMDKEVVYVSFNYRLAILGKHTSKYPPQVIFIP